MVEKEATDGEEAARKAYRAAREESDHAAEMAAGHKVSSALINRVRIISLDSGLLFEYTLQLPPFGSYLTSALRIIF